MRALERDVGELAARLDVTQKERDALAVRVAELEKKVAGLAWLGTAPG